MSTSSGLKNFETSFARLAFDLAAAADSSEAMTALLAAQRSVLMQPMKPLLEVFSAAQSEGALVETRIPVGLEIPRRLAPAISEFLVEGVRNWKAHGKQSRAERKFAAKEEQCRLFFLLEVHPQGIRLELHDDGPGLNPSQVIERLRAAGTMNAAELAALEMAGARGEMAPIYPLLFREGVTTCEQAGWDAGRGVGLSRLEKLASDFGGHVSAGASSRLSGFQLSMELPCSLLGIHVESAQGRLVQPVASGPLDSEGGASGEFRIFYRIPSESRAWASDFFGQAQISWISLVVVSEAESRGFEALGLRLDASNV